MSRKKASSLGRNLSNLDELIGFCNGYGAQYVPDPSIGIDIAALQVFKGSLKQSMGVVKAARTPWKRATNDRELLFAGLEGFSSRIINAMIGSRLPQQTIDDALTIHRKIVGLRSPDSPKPVKEKTPPPPVNKYALPLAEHEDGDDDDEEDDEELQRTISASQRGFDDQADHLRDMLELLSNEPRYLPGAADLTPAAIGVKLAAMEAANKLASDTYTTLHNALVFRNRLINNETDGLVALTNAVKGFVTGVFGVGSAEEKQVTSLEFRRVYTRNGK